MMGTVGSDKTTIANMLQFQNLSKLSEGKKNTINQKLTSQVGDGDLTPKEYTELKTLFLSENKGVTSEDFFKEISAVIGIEAAKTLDPTEGKIDTKDSKIITEDGADVKKIEDTKHEPKTVTFHVLGENSLAVDTDNDITNNKGHHIISNNKNKPVSVKIPEVVVPTKKDGSFDYNSVEGKNLKKSISSFSKKTILDVKYGFSEGGASINDSIDKMKLDDSPSGKLAPKGSLQVQNLQSHLGLPSERQDGVFGAETLSNLKSKYSEALKSGDISEIKKLDNLMNILANVMDKTDPQLRSLVDTGNKVIKNLEIKSDNDKSTETNNKILEKAANIVTIANGSPAVKADPEAAPPIQAKKAIPADPTKAREELKKANLPPNIEKKVLAKIEAKETEIAVEKAKIIEEKEAPNVNPLSDHIINQPKTLKGDDFVQSIGKGSSPRAKAVESGFRALYKQEGSGEDATFKLNRNKGQVRENLGNLLNSDQANNLNVNELTKLIQTYDGKGADSKDIAKILNSLSDPKKAAQVLENLGSDSKIRSVIKEMLQPESNNEVLANMGSKKLGDVIDGYFRDKNAGAVLESLEPKKAAEVLNEMNDGKAEDVFEEMASGDPENWGQIMGELQKLPDGIEKSNKFFDEINRGDGMNSNTVKAKVMIYKHLHIKPENLNGDIHLENLRNDGSPESKELIGKFNDLYQTDSSKNGVTKWVLKKPVVEMTPEKILENITPFEDEGYSGKIPINETPKKTDDIAALEKIKNRSSLDATKSLISFLDENKDSLSTETLTAVESFKSMWPSEAGVDIKDIVGGVPMHNISYTEGLEKIASSLGFNIEMPNIMNKLEGDFDFSQFKVQDTGLSDSIQNKVLSILEEIATKELNPKSSVVETSNIIEE